MTILEPLDWSPLFDPIREVWHGNLFFLIFN